MIVMNGAQAFKTISRYRYLIIQCYSCGQLLIAKSGQKKKLCTYCNTRLNVPRTKILTRAQTAKTASEIVMVLKETRNTL